MESEYLNVIILLIKMDFIFLVLLLFSVRMEDYLCKKLGDERYGTINGLLIMGMIITFMVIIGMIFIK